MQPIEPITSFDSLGATNFIVYYGHMPTERKVCLGQQPSYWPRVSQNRTENPVTESFRGCLQGFTGATEGSVRERLFTRLILMMWIC